MPTTPPPVSPVQAEVAAVLAGYKQLALQYEALARSVHAQMGDGDDAGPGQREWGFDQDWDAAGAAPETAVERGGSGRNPAHLLDMEAPAAAPLSPPAAAALSPPAAGASPAEGGVEPEGSSTERGDEQAGVSGSHAHAASPRPGGDPAAQHEQLPAPAQDGELAGIDVADIIRRALAAEDCPARSGSPGPAPQTGKPLDLLL